MTDKDQQEAIRHVRGPCITVAGPGAGKTHVLTRRIAYLTQSCSIPPQKLLVITFTKAAAIEMRERYLRSVRPEFFGVTFGTFHSVFFQILRKYTHFSQQSLIDSRTKHYIIQSACRLAGIDASIIPDIYGQMQREISYVKNAGIHPGEYEPEVLTKKEFGAFYHLYEKKMSELERLDFDDMLIKAKKLLLKDERALTECRGRYGYVLVDEAQDLNAIQYDILKLIVHPHNNLFMVGDDDQAIYSFRGARPELFLKFEDDYPDTKKIILSKNYRCDREIVRRALMLINNNKVRFEKALSAASSLEGRIRYLSYRDQREEAADIVQRIIAEKQRNADSTHAVLYRNHNQNAFLLSEAKKAGLATKTATGGKRWTDSKTASVFADYFKAALKGERSSFINIMNQPQRYLPRKGLEKKTVDFGEWERFYRNDGDTIIRIENFKKQLLLIRSLPSFAALNYVFYQLGLMEYLKENRQFDADVFERLVKLAGENPDKRQFLRKLERYGNENEMESDDKTADAAGKNMLYMTTFHGSKGLEFDNVYLIDANEGITPGRRKLSPGSLEEERRLFYVAMTRARHNLIISTIGHRGSEIMYPSRFLRELAGEPGLS